MTKHFSTLKPTTVLGVAAHPDDLDFGAGGTLAQFAADGAAIHVLILTDGGKGSADYNVAPEQLVKTRQQEQKDACKLLGVSSVQFLSYRDGELEMSMGLKRDIARVIRELCPDVVITLDPSMIYVPEYGIINHPDHRVAGQATLDAVYPLARDHLSLPELFKDGLKPHKVATVLLINFEHCNYYVDITGTLETKMDAIKAHESQTPDFEGIRRKFTTVASDSGKACGHQYAEGFIRIDVED